MLLEKKQLFLKVTSEKAKTPFSILKNNLKITLAYRLQQILKTTNFANLAVFKVIPFEFEPKTYCLEMSRLSTVSQVVNR
jgi:hypothetical protein